MKLKSLLTILTITVVVLAARQSQATLVIGFSNGDTFDGDVASSTAGPFTDPASGLAGTLTTTALTPSGASLNTTASGLGIDAPGSDTVDAFDSGESWTFSWDQASQFVGIDFGLYSTATEDLAFKIQSAAWIGASITPGSANVSFNSATGAFTFKDGTLSDIFTASDLYGAGAIPLLQAGTAYTLSFNPTAADTARLEGISFNFIPVPEPSTMLLIGVGGFLVWRVRRSRK